MGFCGYRDVCCEERRREVRIGLNRSRVCRAVRVKSVIVSVISKGIRRKCMFSWMKDVKDRISATADSNAASRSVDETIWPVWNVTEGLDCLEVRS